MSHLSSTTNNFFINGQDSNSEPSSISNTQQNQVTRKNEMEELTRNFPWSKTPVGPVNTWPQSLTTMIQTMLASRYPMWLGWGKNLTFFYNDAYAKMTLGPKHPWALGRSFREVWSEIWAELGPLTESVLCSGQATWSEGLLLFLERNGFPEETYHTFSYSPAFDDEGQINGILCVVTEDTERSIGERRLRTIRELAARTNEETKSVKKVCQTAARILENNPKDVPFALLYLLDVEGQYVSLAASCGIKPGSSLSPPIMDLTESEKPWPFMSIIQSGCSAAIENVAEQFGPLPGGPWPEPSPQAIVLPLVKAGQSQFAGFLVVGVSARRPLDDAYRAFFELVAGQISTAIANALALEEERQRVEKLAELDRAKTAFFSNVSHEFRTPLTLMLGPLEEILSKSFDRNWLENRHLLEVVHRNGLRLQRLVNTLLDFSKIEAGRIRACFEPTDISAYTEELASNFRSVCEKAGLNLRVDCPPCDQKIFLDQSMWEKIVLNLLSNAFKFTLEGEIHISVRQLTQVVELRVRDTGLGIAPEEISRLFERFHRIEQNKGRTYEGSGIGLALINELVKLHNGSIMAESKVENGTTFIVTIPLGCAHLPIEQVRAGDHLKATTEAKQFVEEALRWLPEQQNSPASEIEWFNDNILPTSTSSIQQKNPALILVAEDNADMRQYLMRLLSHQYHVEAVSNGEAALTSVREKTPNLIISDAMMPKLDGFGLLKELRKDISTAHIPVIILSARAGEESRIEGMQSGADEYLVKPFSARVLLASVSAHLQMAKLRQETNKTIQESEERFRALTNATSDVAYCMSADWSEMRYLQGREFITNTLEPSKTWIDKYIPLDNQSEVKQAIQEAIYSKKVFELEHPVFRVDGSIGWTYSRAVPILNQDDEIVEWFGAASDVSRRKEAEQALLEALRHKDEFLATLAHELRNPLAPVLNALEIIKRGKNNTSLVEKAQAIMDRQIAQMVRLIDDLLDLSRISHGKIQLQKEHTDLAKIIQRAYETALPTIEAEEHQLQLDIPDFPIYIEADITRLAQVFSNLLNNASKYTERGGLIRLSVRLDQEQVIVSVLDNGMGIPHHMLSYVFEKFTQVDRQLERPKGGLGIGLSLVKQVVELHNGTVEAKSKGENLGSEFLVRLPIALPLVEAKEYADEPLNSNNRFRVLVVDDNIDITESLTMLLGLMGYTIKTACDGLEAIDAASSFLPDLILMDIGMPRLNGYDAAKEIRKRSWGKNIVLVALTGWGQQKDRQQALESGFDFHITKPVQIDSLEKLFNEIGFEME